MGGVFGDLVGYEVVVVVVYDGGFCGVQVWYCFQVVVEEVQQVVCVYCVLVFVDGVYLCLFVVY